MGNVFIIGNGFDLDIGLPTKYSDFANSEFWPKAAPRFNITLGEMKRNMEQGIFTNIPIIPKLEHTIEDAKDKNTWFDLENELLDYAKEYEPTNSNYTRFSYESQSEVSSNIDYYKRLCNSLSDYIKQVQVKQDIIKDSTACMVLKAIIENDCFNSIYSFNYTDLNSIAKRIGITQEINYTHIHGKVSDASIILGVDETPLRKGYESSINHQIGIIDPTIYTMLYHLRMKSSFLVCHSVILIIVILIGSLSNFQKGILLQMTGSSTLLFLPKMINPDWILFLI